MPGSVDPPRPQSHAYEYALIRVAPRVEREEFVNVGAILFCRTLRFLDVRIRLDAARICALHPDVDIAQIETHLALIPQICAGEGPFAKLDLAERFRWVAAPHSTVVQASPIHSGICTDPAVTLEQIFNTMVG